MISDKFRKFLDSTSESRISLREAKKICETAGYSVRLVESQNDDDDLINAIQDFCEENDYEFFDDYDYYEKDMSIKECIGIVTDCESITQMALKLNDYLEDRGFDRTSRQFLKNYRTERIVLDAILYFPSVFRKPNEG